MRNTATPRCPGTLKEGFSTYSPSILRNLLKGRKVNHVLPYTAADLQQDPWISCQIKGEHPGGQLWFRISLVKNKLKPDPNGDYIFKTAGPSSSFRFHLEQAGNEHLTLRIVDQVFKLNAVQSAMIFLEDGQPALFCRNIDFEPGFINFYDLLSKTGIKKPISINDFEYSQLAVLFDRYVAAALIQKNRFYRQVIFQYLIANGNAGLDQYGFIKTTQGDYVLAPLYNSFCTRLHHLDRDLAARGGLYPGDTHSPEFRENGHYSRKEFLELGFRMGIDRDHGNRIIDYFTSKTDQVDNLIEKSFINEEAKKNYRYQYYERLSRLR
jgi:serine/threonine-protein kinase HipA